MTIWSGCGTSSPRCWEPGRWSGSCAAATVENIYVFGPDYAVLGLSGGRQEHVREPVFADEDDMVRYISHLATTHGQTGRRFDQSAPLLDLRLKSGERIFAAMAVCGTPFLTIRCHRHRSIRLEDLVERESLCGAGRRLP